MSTSTIPLQPASKAPVSPAAHDLGDQLLARVQKHRDVIQEPVSLARSLEWDLGQEYLRGRGTKAFTSDRSPVPFRVNNDGSLSRKAAEMFFEAVSEKAVSEKAVSDQRSAASKREEIYVLELGVGVGLFARLFLDRFRELCRKHDKDYYDRLCYVLADRSQRMLLDVARHGILAGHAGHFRFRVVDALRWMRRCRLM